MKWNRATALLSALFLAGMVFSANVKGRLLASPQVPAKSATSHDPASVGSWSAPISIGLVPIHAALLYTGNVLFWVYSCGASNCNPLPTTIAMLYNPSTQQVSNIPTEPFADYFCSGATHLPDGRLLIDGGLGAAVGTGDIGTTNATIFDPATNAFTPQPNMSFARYYPSNISMSDGTQLVVSGQDVTGRIVNQLESWSPTTNTWTTLPATANLAPSAAEPWNNYPRQFLLPSGQLYIANQLYHTWFFNPANENSNPWTFIGNYNEVYRFRGAQVLMPDPVTGAPLTTVMVMGGQEPGFNPTNTTETINLSSGTPAWAYGTPMNNPRHDLNAVQLPDGTVLVIGGAAGSGDYTNPVKSAELYTPSTKQWTVLAAQLGSRGYHSTALLLPDGTVISEGSDSGDHYQTYAEVFSPPYLFKGTRPTIAAAPATFTYGQTFNVTTPNFATISSIALIRLDAVTHANHMDQRFLNLSFTSKGSNLRITAPANSNYAPPGHYMLFLVNSSGVPSVAKIMQLTATPGGEKKMEAIKTVKK
jgi:hypothetical protein